jgi:hypothetical protein
MLRRTSVAAAALLFAFGLCFSAASAQDKKAADNLVEGTLVSLDAAKLQAVVKTTSGNKTIALNKDIHVLGPRDGARRDGLDDDDLDPGAKVQLTMATGGKTASVLKILAKAPTKSSAPAKPAAKGPSGKIVKVDATGMKFTIADKSGKPTDFTFDANTVFIGPRGGVSDQKAKDDRFVVGAPVQLTLGGAGKAVKEIHLPMRADIGK